MRMSYEFTKCLTLGLAHVAFLSSCQHRPVALVHIFGPVFFHFFFLLWPLGVCETVHFVEWNERFARRNEIKHYCYQWSVHSVNKNWIEKVVIAASCELTWNGNRRIVMHGFDSDEPYFNNCLLVKRRNVSWCLNRVQETPKTLEVKVISFFLLFVVQLYGYFIGLASLFSWDCVFSVSATNTHSLSLGRFIWTAFLTVNFEVNEAFPFCIFFPLVFLLRGYCCAPIFRRSTFSN